MISSGWKAEVLLAGSWRGATSVLLSNGVHHIVVDSGLPHETHQLVQALEKKGVHPPDVKIVINTHFHLDHVSNNCLFPASSIYATQESYEWCRSLYSDLRDEINWEKLVLKYYPETPKYERAEERMIRLRRFALRWWEPTRFGSPAQFRWMEMQPIPDGLESLTTSGHVPGHVSIIARGRAQGEEHATVIAGDALLSKEDDERVLTMIPRSRQQFALDRERLLSMYGTILPGHGTEFVNPSAAEHGISSLLNPDAKLRKGS